MSPLSASYVAYLRLFLMVSGNSLREILVVLNGLVRFLVAIYYTQILFQI